mgnify:CR=1 FL=1
MSQRRAGLGFTLLELLVTVALLSIIITSVTPSIGNFYKRNKVASIVNNHTAALQLARHTAVNENVFVVVCPTKDMTTCEDDWTMLKMVFIDEDADGALDGNEEIIGSADMVKSFQITSTRDNLRFAPFNTAQNSTATITICPDEDDTHFARALVISNVGRVRLEKDPTLIDCSAS